MKAPVAICCLLLPLAAMGQDRIPVQVIHTGDDPVGFAIHIEVRRAISASARMYSAADFHQARIVLVITSVDPNPRKDGNSTAIARTIIYNPRNNPMPPLAGMWLASGIQVCARNTIVECAREMLAVIETEASTLRTMAPELWKELVQAPAK